MDNFRLEIVTAERLCFSEDIISLVVPGAEGELGILPHHAPLMTMIQAGELVIKRPSGKEEIYWAITGGFLEVRPEKVIILADACEMAEEIDIARAEEAKKRAEESIKNRVGDHALAEASLRRSLARLRVAEHRRRRNKAV